MVIPGIRGIEKEGELSQGDIDEKLITAGKWNSILQGVSGTQCETSSTYGGAHYLALPASASTD